MALSNAPKSAKQASTMALVTASIIGGIAGAVLMQFASTRQAAPANGAGTEGDAAHPAPRDADLEARLDQMNAKLRALEAKQQSRGQEGTRDDAQPEPAAPQAELPEPTTELSREQSRLKSVQRLADRDLAFQSEPIDAKWARSVAADFDADLSALIDKSSGKFEVMDLSCRSKTCRGVLRFDDRSAAIDVGHGLLQADYQQNCARSIFTIEPAENAPPSNEFLATVFFDCGDTQDQAP